MLKLQKAKWIFETGRRAHRSKQRLPAVGPEALMGCNTTSNFLKHCSCSLGTKPLLLNVYLHARGVSGACTAPTKLPFLIISLAGWPSLFLLPSLHPKTTQLWLHERALWHVWDTARLTQQTCVGPKQHLDCAIMHHWRIPTAQSHAGLLKSSPIVEEQKAMLCVFISSSWRKSIPL